MDVKDFLAQMFEINAGPVQKSIEDIDDAESLTRGLDKVNHIRWNAGHLVCSAGLMVKIMGGTSNISEEWNKLFIRGAKFSENSSVYPSMDDLRAKMKEVHQDMKEALKEASLEYLETEKEVFPGWNTTPANAVTFICEHEFYHLGQIATLRRILGREQMFG